MEWAVGVMAAKRPMMTWQETVWNLQNCGWRPSVFAEWDVPDESPWGNIPVRFIRRPICSSPHFSSEQIGPDGRMGIFQNFIQTLADLLWLHPVAEAIMVVHDDVLINLRAKQFIEEILWPARSCGMVSLYCPDRSPYRREQRGLFPVDVPEWFGSQALIFRRETVIELLKSDSIIEWKGDYQQRQTMGVPSWERRGVDSWIGGALLNVSARGWCICPSLARHYSPLLSGGFNSALTMPRCKNSGDRIAYKFIGDQANPWNIFPRVPERTIRDKLREWDEWHSGHYSSSE